MSDTLRTAIIRLAYANPELRAHLLPLVEKSAGTYQDYVSGKKDEGEQPKLDKDEWEARYGDKGGKGDGEKKPLTVRDAIKETDTISNRLYDGLAKANDPKARPGSGFPHDMRKNPVFKEVFKLMDEAEEEASIAHSLSTGGVAKDKSGKSIPAKNLGAYAASSLKKHREAEKALGVAAKKWKEQQG
jgi:hypothetical protein